MKLQEIEATEMVEQKPLFFLNFLCTYGEERERETKNVTTEKPSTLSTDCSKASSSISKTSASKVLTQRKWGTRCKKKEEEATKWIIYSNTEPPNSRSKAKPSLIYIMQSTRGVSHYGLAIYIKNVS